MLAIAVEHLVITWRNNVGKNSDADGDMKVAMPMRDSIRFGREVSKYFYFFDISACSRYKSNGIFSAGQS